MLQGGVGSLYTYIPHIYPPPCKIHNHDEIYRDDVPYRGVWRILQGCMAYLTGGYGVSYRGVWAVHTSKLPTWSKGLSLQAPFHERTELRFPVGIELSPMVPE